MMPSRGMGKISPSKMPKQKTITRKDGDKVSLYKKGGKVKRFDEGDLVAAIAPELLGNAGEMAAQQAAEEAARKIAEEAAQKAAAEEATKRFSDLKAAQMNEINSNRYSPPDKVNIPSESSLSGRPTGYDRASKQLSGMLNYETPLSKDSALRIYGSGSVGPGGGRLSSLGGQYSMRFAEGGLYDNINAKKKRIAAGSGEKMRKPGSKGAPTKQAFIKSAKTAKR